MGRTYMGRGREAAGRKAWAPEMKRASSAPTRERSRRAMLVDGAVRSLYFVVLYNGVVCGNDAWCSDPSEGDR